MVDTNAFDFIYDNDLIRFINKLVMSEQIELYVTHVQLDEIGKISNDEKKEKIMTVYYTPIVASVGFVGTSESTPRGYVGGRTDAFIVVNEEDNKIINKVKRTLTESHPLGNAADITIAFTAVKKEVDYLVSNDSGIHNVLKKFTSAVKGITNDEFYEILKKIEL